MIIELTNRSGERSCVCCRSSALQHDDQRRAISIQRPWLSPSFECINSDSDCMRWCFGMVQVDDNLNNLYELISAEFIVIVMLSSVFRLAAIFVETANYYYHWDAFYWMCLVLDLFRSPCAFVYVWECSRFCVSLCVLGTNIPRRWANNIVT